MSAFDKQEGGSHYTKCKIQPFQYSMANNLDPMQHTVVKYVTRFRDKGGVADLKKAIHTLELLIEHEEVKDKKDTPDPHPTLKSAAKVWGLPLPIGTDPEAIRDLRAYIKDTRIITEKADALIHKQAKLVCELRSGESTVNIIAPTYEIAQSLARDKGWPLWTYYPASSNFHGLRERVFILYLTRLSSSTTWALSTRNIVIELD